MCLDFCTSLFNQVCSLTKHIFPHFIIVRSLTLGTIHGGETGKRMKAVKNANRLKRRAS